MDGIPREIQQWIDRKYPKPTVDREWLAQCFEWAVEQEDIGPVPPYPTKLFKSIERQLLQSNLSDSMDLSTGLPQNIGDVKTKLTLPGTPTLVEVVDKDDTGVSAFQLDQVRKAREERIQAGGFDENGEGDEEADIEVEGEGPLPKYPRATLGLVLSDGKTQFKALEYKSIPDLSLPKLPYGLKMQLKDVRIVAGVAFLQPSNVIICGGQSDLNEHKDFLFRQKLRERMGLPREPMPAASDEGEDNDENENRPPPHHPPPAPAPAAALRSPLREISAPPSPIMQSNRYDDEDLEPRRRRVPSTSSTLLPSVSRSRVSSTSAYFASNASTAVDSAALSMALSPTLRSTAPTLVTRNAPSSPMMSDFEEDFDFNMLDEIESQALATTSKPAPAPFPTSKNRPTAIAGPSRPRVASGAGSSGNKEPEDLTLIDVEPRETAFPRIFSSPPSCGQRKLHLTSEFASSLQSGQAKGKATSSKTPFPTVNDAEPNDLFDDSTMDLGSDDLRQLESVEQLAFPTKVPTSRPRTSSSSVTVNSGPSPLGRRRAARVPPSSQPPPANTEFIEIPSSDESESEGDDDEGMEVDKENMPVERRRVRPRVIAGASRVAASQRMPPSQRPRPRPAMRATSPDEIVEISD